MARRTKLNLPVDVTDLVISYITICNTMAYFLISIIYVGK